LREQRRGKRQFERQCVRGILGHANEAIHGIRGGKTKNDKVDAARPVRA
jgi:hypothetical protein